MACEEALWQDKQGVYGQLPRTRKAGEEGVNSTHWRAAALVHFCPLEEVSWGRCSTSASR